MRLKPDALAWRRMKLVRFRQAPGHQLLDEDQGTPLERNSRATSRVPFGLEPPPSPRRPFRQAPSRRTARACCSRRQSPPLALYSCPQRPRARRQAALRESWRGVYQDARPPLTTAASSPVEPRRDVCKNTKTRRRRLEFIDTSTCFLPMMTIPASSAARTMRGVCRRSA